MKAATILVVVAVAAVIALVSARGGDPVDLYMSQNRVVVTPFKKVDGGTPKGYFTILFRQSGTYHVTVGASGGNLGQPPRMLYEHKQVVTASSATRVIYFGHPDLANTMGSVTVLEAEKVEIVCYDFIRSRPCP